MKRIEEEENKYKVFYLVLEVSFYSLFALAASETDLWCSYSRLHLCCIVVFINNKNKANSLIHALDELA